MTTLLIDNYDSFTWNVHQLLHEAGAKSVTVHRNDAITLAQVQAMQPRNIVISPGPGRPADSGVCYQVIREMAGKCPILGVCLGQQAIYEVFGGRVSHCGSIVHGKTSLISRTEGDDEVQGMMVGLPSQLQVTRYHSLAADPATMPTCLKVTCMFEDIIMGVRHRELSVEGVQFHPESILSEHGVAMMRNFLQLDGGRWSVVGCRPALLPKTHLNGIMESRRALVNAGMLMPGCGAADMEVYLQAGCASTFATVDVYSMLTRASMSIMAEVKRASPSKGPFDMAANAVSIALDYARAGARVISVLTEPRYFHGHLHDLMFVRRALDGVADRPAVLRKDFIYSRYQIQEARLYGADIVLLIVSIVGQELKQLLSDTRALEMCALVEVNNAEEMVVALEAGSRLVGVNNRNLDTFQVDLETTVNLSSMVHDWNKSHADREPVLLVALSGISTRDHVRYFEKSGAKACLVGEALMRANDRHKFIADLLGRT